MFYKFGIEPFNGSTLTMATNRYNQDAFNQEETSRTSERFGLPSGLNQARQYIGSILITPLIKRYSSRLVLSLPILNLDILKPRNRMTFFIKENIRRMEFCSLC